MAVLGRPEARVELERLIRSQWSDHVAGEMRIRPLRSHAHRCTFQVSIGPEDDGQSVIAKVYDEDRSDVFAMMESVVAAGFGHQATFAIPRPFGYLPSHRVLVQEKIPGTEAVEIFRGDDVERQTEAARRSGAWLGHFHTKATPQGRFFGPDRIRYAIRFWAREIGDSARPFVNKADLLLRKLEAAEPAVLGGFEPHAGHGTYMSEHVVLSGARTVSIDLDGYLIADPAHDLAWFIVSLERLGLERRKSLRVFDRAIEEFLRGYASTGPRVGLSHLPFFRAAMFLYVAHHDLFNRHVPLPELSELMLDEGIDSLRLDGTDPDDIQDISG